MYTSVHAPTIIFESEKQFCLKLTPVVDCSCMSIAMTEHFVTLFHN